MNGRQETTGQKSGVQCLAMAGEWRDTARQSTRPTEVEVQQQHDRLLQKWHHLKLMFTCDGVFNKPTGSVRLVASPPRNQGSFTSSFLSNKVSFITKNDNYRNLR